jgi:hypothetical protein
MIGDGLPDKIEDGLKGGICHPARLAGQLQNQGRRAL